MRSGLFIPLFDGLADPVRVAQLAAEAEEAGWDGGFAWDHLRWREPVQEVADPWITLAAIATATQRIRLGPMVTPLARRRPTKVARETATLDGLSGGRLTLGVGLGNDQAGREWSITGEELDDGRRARMLDESLAILKAAWSGELVHHRGEHYTVDGMRFLPRPTQRPGIPVWVAARTASLDRFAAPPATKGSFPSTSSTPTSSPSSPPPSQPYGERQAGIPASPTTSSPPSRPATTRRPMGLPAPPGGRLTSRPTPSRSTGYAA